MTNEYIVNEIAIRKFMRHLYAALFDKKSEEASHLSEKGFDVAKAEPGQMMVMSIGKVLEEVQKESGFESLKWFSTGLSAGFAFSNAKKEDRDELKIALNLIIESERLARENANTQRG